MANNNRELKIMGAWLYEYTYGLSYETIHLKPVFATLGDFTFFPLVDIQKTSFEVNPRDSVLLDTVNVTKPDLLFIRPYKDTLQPETIKYISENTTTKTVALFGDDEKYFYMSPCASYVYAPCFNVVTTNYKPALKSYKSIGIQAFWNPFGANNEVFKKTKEAKDTDVSFVGEFRPERGSFLNYLAARQVSIRVYGSGWADDGKLVIDHNQYVSLVNRTKINLNINREISFDKEIQQIKGRDFEIPMAGGFLLTGKNELLSDFYKVGEEIEVYDDEAECFDKIKYYLKHESKRAKIAAAGYAKSQKAHTYKKRYADLFKKLRKEGVIC